MIRVMILAFDYPPLASAGAQRPYGWYRYLSQFDVYPVVITRHWDSASVDTMAFVSASTEEEVVVEVNDQGTVIRTPYYPNLRDKIILKFGPDRFVSIRKTFSFLLSFLKFYFRKFDNTNPIFQIADNYLENNSCDLIIATGEPFILFRHAFVLGKKYNIPYILDYRDGWTDSMDLEHNQPQFKLLNRALFGALEKKYLISAKAVIAASKYYLKKLIKINSDNNYYEILNGYFEEEFQHLNKHRSEKFTVIYSGRLYKFQPVEEFLDALNEKASERNNIKIAVHFIGAENDPEIMKRIRRYIGNSVFEIILTPRTVYKEYAEKLVNADLLLLLSDNVGGWLNAKLFDYLAAGKTILLYRNDQAEMADIITACKSGYICNHVNELKETLEVIFDAYHNKKELAPDTEALKKFSRCYQVRKLSQIIKSCVE